MENINNTIDTTSSSTTTTTLTEKDTTMTTELKSYAKVETKSIWAITKSHPRFAELVQNWKDNMSTPNSKVINARIQWTEATGLLPIIALGVKGERVRFAAFGGSDGINYLTTSDFASDDIQKLEAKNNDEVTAWRDSILILEQPKATTKEPKSANGRPSKKLNTSITISNNALYSLSSSIASINSTGI